MQSDDQNLRDQLREQWMKFHGVAPSKRAVGYMHLLGSREVYRRRLWEDHEAMFVKDGKPYLYVSQPYGLFPDEARALARDCKLVGLKFRVSRFGWHAPGRVLLIEVYNPKLCRPRVLRGQRLIGFDGRWISGLHDGSEDASPKVWLSDDDANSNPPTLAAQPGVIL